MTFYIASGVENAARVNEAAAVLTKLGHRRTYNWTLHGSVKGAAVQKKQSIARVQKKQSVARLECDGVLSASLFVLLLPGAKGTHAELGMALAKASLVSSEMRVLVWSKTSGPFDGTDGFCVFYHHPAVERIVCPFPALLARLSTIESQEAARQRPSTERQ